MYFPCQQHVFTSSLGQNSRNGAPAMPPMPVPGSTGIGPDVPPGPEPGLKSTTRQDPRVLVAVMKLIGDFSSRDRGTLLSRAPMSP